MNSNSAIDFWKKFLLKCFIVGYVLTLISFFLWYYLRDFSFNFTHNMMGINQEVYNILVLNFFTAAKFLIFYLFLTPSLALYWVAKCNKADWKKNIKLDDQ